MGPIIALYSTVKCDVRSLINLSWGISEEGVTKKLNSNVQTDYFDNENCILRLKILLPIGDSHRKLGNIL